MLTLAITLRAVARFSIQAACCNICVKTPGCTAWTWNGPNGNLLCYPKLNCTSPKYNNSGVQSGGAPPAPPSPHPKPPPPSPPPPSPPPPAPPAEHPGILDVVKEFGVDNTGKTDVTVKLQAAITAAYDQQLACFFPPGRYAQALRRVIINLVTCIPTTPLPRCAACYCHCKHYLSAT